MREVFQAREKRNQDIKQMPRGEKGKWPSSMRSFSGRLRWHCHFIQKLEDQPSIEFKCMHSAYEGMRSDKVNDNFLKAWKSGKTGFPFIDACMRSLIYNGWITFRMSLGISSMPMLKLLKILLKLF